MKMLKAVVLALLVYVAVGAALMVLVHVVSPADFDERGRLLGGVASLFGLATQGLSCFLAGGVAMACVRGVPWATMVVASSALFALDLASCAAFWSDAPAWYNWVTLAMTLPFAALGVAWKAALPQRAQGAEFQ